ncbi:MAG TPA: TIGR04168 family protein [Cyanobacteria bacterium UBA11159]|nr:TIGR04168 family protein [Cyanobacteria bacterium UBA11367]HBE56711.1 TIGR04168 family protein [Cyanobacteria bacterium UBA11366]HBK63049.1 TIGR04168 family protein [Cyanobacteria bacterium UBA11166]HBR72199.1 TIGR04168 family protein [Cyanobacteria bacterium UBA11159]HBS70397.1 TIGR04168 family protein [Cyanobacteria bacterium UBA11153]HCA97173.1 TIGR04168 family protein [Cyanobacteria bacterium UBA9226]
MKNDGKKISKIAVIGDIHDLWEAEDAIALQHLAVDLALFVGDFGNESVEIVREIAALDIPKAVMMGNHDAWYTASEWGRKKCPYNREEENWVQEQLDLLGETHVGYGYLDFPQFQLSVVGSRPFSWGGGEWKNHEFMEDLYGIIDFSESSELILRAAKSTKYNTIIFLGHNGPTGLGDKPEAPCGKDWQPLGGDYGDPDFQIAIAQTQELGKNIPLVTFGHMHHRLRHTKQRLREIVSTDALGTVYLNSASVPRIIETQTDRLRNFSLVSLENDIVSEISLVWVGQDYAVVSEDILYSREKPLPCS